MKPRIKRKAKHVNWEGNELEREGALIWAGVKNVGVK